MGQVNVNPSGGGVVERDGSGRGLGMGVIIAIVAGIVLLAIVAWYAFTPSGFLAGGNAGTANRSQTNVNVTNSQPAPPASQPGR